MEVKELDIDVSEMTDITEELTEQELKDFNLSLGGNDVQIKDDSERRKDPTPEELFVYFKQVDERLKAINNQKDGVKEFTFDDGFSCVARNQKNADRKHNNWKNGI